MADTANLQDFYLKLNKNYNTLREREAKYATAAPLDLLNQLDDYEYALELAQEALDSEIPLEELEAGFSGLNLQLDTVVFVAQEPPRKPFTGRNPYRGLRTFTEQEAEFFFGRTEAIQSLLEIVEHLIKAETSRELPDLVAVLGPSGSGKSSLVRAGLIPALRQGGLPGSEHWPIKVMMPGPRPLNELAAQFVDLTGRGLPELRADLNRGEQALHQLMIESLTGKPEEAIFMLVIDQFEEVFTLCENKAEQQLFLKQLLYVTQSRHNRGFVLITMRSDFYGKVADHKRLADVITLNQMLVSPMTEKEIREAILLPAEAVGLELEKALVESLLKDTYEAPGILPLLQHTLTELFRQRDGNLLTLEAYQQMGGVKGALAHRADAVLDAMPMHQRHIARRIFMRLVRPGEGTADTRRRATFSEVVTQDVDVSEIEQIIQTLTDANLIVTSLDDETDEMILDVSHEALIREWPRLRSWLAWDRRGLRIRQELSRAAVEWDERRRDESNVYRGARLLEAEEWAAENPGEINPLEQDFVTASMAARDRARRRTRLVIAGLAVGLVVAVIGAIFGLLGQRDANFQRDQAVTAEADADQAKVTAVAGQAAAQTAQVVADDQREEALLARGTAEAGQQEAREAQAIAEEERAEAERQSQISLAQSLAVLAPSLVEQNGDTELADLLAVEAEYLNRQVGGAVQPLVDSSLRNILSSHFFNTILSGHELSVRSVAFSPDGQILASAGDDGAVRLWQAADPSAEPEIISGLEGGVLALAFSPDGQTLALAGDDWTVRLWNVAADPPQESATLSGHQGIVWAVAFSPDGQTLASAGDDGAVRLWALSDPAVELEILSGHEQSIRALAFSPDGQTLASAGFDQTINLWRLADLAAEPEALQAHDGPIWALTFSPDGQTLASGSSDQTIKLWPLANLAAGPVTLSGHPATVRAVAFSPDGETVASGGEDGAIWLWLAADPTARPQLLSDQEDLVWSLAFSPDGRRLASAGVGVNITLWDLAPPPASPKILRGHQGWVEAVEFSPDGQFLASGSDDAAVLLWDWLDVTAEPVTLSGHRAPVRAVAFSPNGQFLASGGEDQAVFLWDLADLTAPGQLLGRHPERVFAVAFGPAPPAGSSDFLLASGSVDGTIWVWDLANPAAEPVIVSREGASVNALAFSPNGQVLAAGDADGSVRLFRAAGDFTEFAVLGGHEGSVQALAFNPSGQILASAGADRTLKLWNMANPAAQPTSLDGHEGVVFDVAFSPDNAPDANRRLMASAGADGAIRLWDLNNLAVDPTVLRGHDDDRIFSMAFSPDGHTLASGSADRTVRLWIARTDALAELACRQVRRNLSAREWQRFRGNLDQYRLTCPDLPLPPSLVQAAEALAADGDRAGAVFLFRHLLELDPTLDLQPEARAQQAFRAGIDRLLEEGRSLALAGQVEAAGEKFRDALKRDPALGLGLAREARRLAEPTLETLVETVVERAGKGDAEAASSSFRQALTLAESSNSARAWGVLCTVGARHALAGDALAACDRAIEQAPDNGLLYNSRAIARLQAGDQPGAREDFLRFEDWLEENGPPGD